MRRFNVVQILLVTYTVASGLGTRHAIGQEREADHEELRALRRTVTAAVSSKQFDLLEPVIDDSFTVITVDNQKFEGLAAFRDYWNSLFEGEDALLNSITGEAEADALTEFLSENVGVAQGTSVNILDFKALGERELPIRWTAVVRKVDGRWRISKLHLSGNINDNPVVDATRMLGNVKARRPSSESPWRTRRAASRRPPSIPA